MMKLTIREGGPNGSTTTVEGVRDIERGPDGLVLTTDNDTYEFMSDAHIIDGESQKPMPTAGGGQ